MTVLRSHATRASTVDFALARMEECILGVSLNGGDVGDMILHLSFLFLFFENRSDTGSGPVVVYFHFCLLGCP